MGSLPNNCARAGRTAEKAYGLAVAGNSVGLVGRVLLRELVSSADRDGHIGGMALGMFLGDAAEGLKPL